MKKLLLTMSALALTATTPAFCACSADAQSLIKESRNLYAERMDFGKALAALSGFEKAFATDGTCAEAAARAARAAWWVADQQASKKDRVEGFQKGIDLATAAVAVDPNSADAHFWLAVNYGSSGETMGVMKSLAMVKLIRKELNEVIRIDPSHNEGGAYRVLGVVDYKVPGIAGGSKKRAKEQLEKSLGLGSRNPFNVFYFAEYYSVVGDKAKAREYLKTLSELKSEGEALPDLLMMQKKGRALSTKLN